jgi:hypothetical protein
MKNTRQVDPIDPFVAPPLPAPHTPVRPALRVTTQSPQEHDMPIIFQLEGLSPDYLSSSPLLISPSDEQNPTPPPPLAPTNQDKEYQFVYMVPSSPGSPSKGLKRTPQIPLPPLTTVSSASDTPLSQSPIQHTRHGRSRPRCKLPVPKRGCKTRDIEEFYTLDSGSAEKTCTFCEYVPTFFN